MKYTAIRSEVASDAYSNVVPDSHDWVTIRRQNNRLGLRASDSRWTCIFEQVSTVLDVYS